MVRVLPSPDVPAPADDGPARSLRAKLAAATGAAGLVLVVGGMSYWGVAQYRGAADRVQHTAAVRTALGRVSARMAGAEAGARGFVITGTDVYADQYARAAGEARAALAAARRLAADDPAQRRRLDDLAPVLDRRLAVLGVYMEERRARGLAAVADEMRTGPGRRLSDSVLAVVAAADRDEARQLPSATGCSPAAPACSTA